MSERLIDYAIVAVVIVIVLAIFKLSRIVLNGLLSRLRKRHDKLSSDHILATGFITLLAGLLFLPSVTALLALLDRRHLAGGMVLHLFLVALSIVMFSIAEDLFRLFSTYPPGESWSRGKHFQTVAFPIAAFWAIGCIFLSPLFYSGLTIILSLFYLYAVSCRPATDAQD